tara:strand:+ start:5497 stop:6183 length:687 start_codon:yes stop_codon:yes gene_type:complete
MKSLHNLFSLFYPNICVCCEQNLLDQEKLICLECRFDLPFVDNGNYKSNLLTQTLEGRVIVASGASFLYYHPVGKVKKLIHQLKYKNNQEVGAFLGNWFGKKLLESDTFNDIDYIIPVPLHKKKLKQRGYNQLTKFGEKLSEIFYIQYIEDVLIRTSTANTQTFKKRIERFKNSETKFSVSNLDLLNNKHILLIDDVVTTGATLEACCKELLKAKNVKISVITLALTE